MSAHQSSILRQRAFWCILAGALVFALFTIYRHVTNPPVTSRVALAGLVTLDLPGGSRHRVRQGIDTWVGDITLGGTGLTLHYDIGHLGGNFATQTDVPGLVWQRHEEHDGLSFDYSLRRRDGEQVLYVSFPGASANFYCTNRDQNDIEAVLRVLRTLRPVPEAAGTG